MNSEVKILNIDLQKVTQKLLQIGAKKVFDEDRTITYFSNNPAHKPFLKLTEEGEKLKLTSQDLENHTEVNHPRAPFPTQKNLSSLVKRGSFVCLTNARGINLSQTELFDRHLVHLGFQYIFL